MLARLTKALVMSGRPQWCVCSQGEREKERERERGGGGGRGREVVMPASTESCERPPDIYRETR